MEELNIQNFKWDFDWKDFPYKIVSKNNPKEYYEREQAYGIYSDLQFWTNLSKDPLRNDVIIMKNKKQIKYEDLLLDVRDILNEEISEWMQLRRDLTKPDHGGYTSGFSADSFDIDNYLHNPDGTLYKSPTSVSFYGKIEWLRNSIIPELLASRKQTIVEVNKEFEFIKWRNLIYGRSDKMRK